MGAVAAARQPGTTDAQWATVLARFDGRFGRLVRLVEEVYGPGEATARELSLLADQLATSWQRAARRAARRSTPRARPTRPGSSRTG